MNIAVTIGDPSGIGPEIACKLAENTEFVKYHDVTFVGYRSVFEKTYEKVLKRPMPTNINIVEPDENMSFEWQFGEHNADCGKASMLFVKKAAEMAMNGDINAMVTCPINKKSIQMGGFNYPGHTEFLAEISNSPKVSMLLAGSRVRAVLATTHLPIKDVASKLTSEMVYNAIKNANAAARFFCHGRPKVAVCGLNPHAGDNGAIGDEESTIIMPAVLRARAEFLNASDPMPADSLFSRVVKGDYDFVVVMYHDQGLIPVKMDSFGDAVNVSLNLPFIRTSVDHGTAFNIAGKNIANHASLVQAVKIASDMVNYAKSAKNL